MIYGLIGLIILAITLAAKSKPAPKRTRAETVKQFRKGFIESLIAHGWTWEQATWIAEEVQYLQDDDWPDAGLYPITGAKVDWEYTKAYIEERTP